MYRYRMSEKTENNKFQDSFKILKTETPAASEVSNLSDWVNWLSIWSLGNIDGFIKDNFSILNRPKPSLGSCELPQKMWARSVHPFWRLLDTNGQTDSRTSKVFIYRFSMLGSLSIEYIYSMLGSFSVNIYSLC